jgi:AmmeMemoRadiSam system protein B
MARKSIFGGTFYPNKKEDIEKFISESINSVYIDKDKIRSAYSYVAPHAGYVYSGKTASYTYKAIAEKVDIDEIETVIIIGPNHTGIGTPISISNNDWETPLGIVKNDTFFSKVIKEESRIAEIDETAHEFEHSIEVQLPFLQYIGMGKKKFVFICMGDQDINSCNDLSAAISKASKKLDKKALVIASSDFNHFESAKKGKEKDAKLLKELETLEYERFNALVGRINDTACGYGPITVSAMFAKERGAKKSILLDYSNSGDITKDFSNVVDYASLAFV